MSGTIYVQRTPDGQYAASIAELPGCVARAATREGAAAAARAAFRDYQDLHARRGVSTERWAALDPAAFEVREAPASGSLPEDGRPLDEHELRDFLHQFEALHAELLAVARGLDAKRMERRPREGAWSVRETLEHVATSQVSYLAKLEKWPANDFTALKAAHRMVVQRFAVMEAGETVLDHEIAGRRWTVRKVMRRLLAHEYEHLNQAREIAAALD